MGAYWKWKEGGEKKRGRVIKVARFTFKNYHDAIPGCVEVDLMPRARP